MAFGSSTRAGTPGSTRSLAMLICALALGLLAWRGAAVLTGPAAPAPSNAAEAALADIVSPIAGPGLSRLSVTFNAEGGRTVLIVLDKRASAQIPELERIAALAAGIIPEQGDRLVIETVTFAAGIPGRPTPEQWAELIGLAVLALAGGGLIAVSGTPLTVQSPAAQLISAPAAAPERTPERTPAQAPRAPRPVPVAQPTEAAAEIARRDPARAAAVVRGWMNTRDEIA
jgi:flagellar biosynthesis/type III secretory pathway M-ring protein FliF/YscJ